MRFSQLVRRVLVAVAATALVAACAGDATDDGAEGTTTTTTMPDTDDPDADDEDEDEDDLEVGDEVDDEAEPEEPTEPGAAADPPPGTELNEDEGLDNPTVAVADLTAEAVVPGPGAPDTTGRAELIAVVDDRLCVDLRIEHPPAEPLSGHLHAGAAAGETGDAVLDLDLGGHEPEADGAALVWSDLCHAADADLIDSLAVSTDAFYVQIHGDDYPNGAARGQLQASSLFDLTLS